MNTIFKIARAELRNLFYSPVAWFLAIIFMIQCAIFFTESVYQLTKMQELYMKSPSFKSFGSSLTTGVFFGGGIFSSVMQNLYLFIPLLTMGVLSREISNGSIKLLYSSPIKTRQIVLGKYLSLMFYSLILLLIVAVFLVVGNFNIKATDNGLLLSAALGFYLLVCAYAAIGFFMSSLTTYQIVSAIGTFLIIFILGKIGSLWQDIDFIRDLTYFLAMPSRTKSMLYGLITTKDVIYYLIIIAMFLGFTLIKLKSGRESKPKYLTASKYILIIVVSLLLGYFTSRPQYVGYWDTTAQKSNTIHPRVQKIMQELGDEPLEVTLYTNLLGENVGPGLPVNRNNYLAQLWEQYVRFKPDIKFKYELYYDLLPDAHYFKSFPGKSIDEIAKDVAISKDLDLDRFQKPEQIRAKIDLRSEDLMLIMQLKYKGKSIFLRTYHDSRVWPDQEHVAAALSRLMGKQIPQILFTSGNLERNLYVEGERGYYYLTVDKGGRSALINNGFDIDSIELDKQDIPGDSSYVAALVVADPKTELSTVKKQKIQDFIDKGGNVMFLGESGKEGMLNPLIEPLGVQFMQGTLIQVSQHNVPDITIPYLSKNSAYLAEEARLLRLREPDFTDTFPMPFESAVPIIELANNTTYTKKPLIVTRPEVWLKRGKLVRDSVPPIINPGEGDIQLDSFITTMSLTRQIHNKEQRIIVAGDGDFLSNRGSGGFGYYGRALFSWMNDNEYPKYGPVPPPKDNLMLISSVTATVLKKTFVWIIPGLLTALAITVLIRRKRK